MRIERDAAFWDDIASRPEVNMTAMMGSELSLAEVVAHPSVIPIASEHGGFLVIKLDGIGRVYELHSLFSSEGWGREVISTAREGLTFMFERGMQVLVTYEVEGNWRSKPPKSHGWKAAGEFADTEFGNLKSWILTRAAWEASPAYNRMN